MEFKPLFDRDCNLEPLLCLTVIPGLESTHRRRNFTRLKLKPEIPHTVLRVAVFGISGRRYDTHERLLGFLH
jgi:hypothetical protein